MGEETYFPRTLYSLQLLRFIAALFVLLFHLDLLKSGYKGVDIFFVISGFVMYYSAIIEKRRNLRVFVINRVTKVYLLYWLVLIAFYCIRPYTIDTYLINTILLIPNHTSILGVSWSLSYELYFYCIFAGVAFFTRNKLQARIFWTFLFISTLITLLNFTPYTFKGSFLHFLAGQNIWEFLLGIFCGYLFKTRKIHPYISASLAITAGLAISISSFEYAKPIGFLVYGLLSFLTVLFITSYEKQAAFDRRASTIMKLLGDASYSIYLIGPVVTMALAPSTFKTKILTIIFIIIISIVVNQLIETKLLLTVRLLLNKMLFTVKSNHK